MALSVLTIKRSRKYTHGLWDTVAEKFIFKGIEDECYEVKHNLEREEQKEYNETWKADVFHKHVNLLTTNGVPLRKAAVKVRKYVKQSK